MINAVTNSGIKINEMEGDGDMCLALDEMCQDARDEEARKIVGKLLQKGMPDEWIMEVTEISQEVLMMIKAKQS